MYKIIAAFVVALAVAPAAASDTRDVMATVHQFADSLNQGKTGTALAACAAPSSVIDEFPPYQWQGATACADWANDFDTYNKKYGITQPIVKLGTPRHVDITGDRAYVVVPATYTYTYTHKGKRARATESGSTLTVALQKVTDGWRLTGWAWTKR